MYYGIYYIIYVSPIIIFKFNSHTNFIYIYIYINSQSWEKIQLNSKLVSNSAACVSFNFLFFILSESLGAKIKESKFN